MSRKMVLSRIAASALAMGMIAGLAPTAQAQAPGGLPLNVECQYLTFDTNPLMVTEPVSDVFDLTVLALQENKKQTKVLKGTGYAEIGFLAGSDSDELVERVLSGSFNAEVDANLKPSGDLICTNTAKVRGIGLLNVDTDYFGQVTWLIRDGSKLDGKKRAGTAAACPNVTEEFTSDFCSYHRVKATVRFTAADDRDNGSLKYDRFTSNDKDIYEAYTGEAPTKSQGVVLACGCLEE